MLHGVNYLSIKPCWTWLTMLLLHHVTWNHLFYNDAVFNVIKYCMILPWYMESNVLPLFHFTSQLFHHFATLLSKILDSYALFHAVNYVSTVILHGVNYLTTLLCYKWSTILQICHVLHSRLFYSYVMLHMQILHKDAMLYSFFKTLPRYAVNYFQLCQLT